MNAYQLLHISLLHVAVTGFHEFIKLLHQCSRKMARNEKILRREKYDFDLQVTQVLYRF
jgi:hypothetical protein